MSFAQKEIFSNIHVPMKIHFKMSLHYFVRIKKCNFIPWSLPLHIIRVVLKFKVKELKVRNRKSIILFFLKPIILFFFWRILRQMYMWNCLKNERKKKRKDKFKENSLKTPLVWFNKFTNIFRGLINRTGKEFMFKSLNI